MIVIATILFQLHSINNQQSGITRILRASASFATRHHAEATIEKSSDEASASPHDTMRRRVLDMSDESIRSWGCNMTSTPFLFVHIGKAGGGNVRRRIAAAALNFTRNPNSWSRPQLDHHYYPVRGVNRNETNGEIGGTSIHRATLCNSGRKRHLPVSTLVFEGVSQRCTATTPLGHILACPEIFGRYCQPQDPLDPNSAHIVYMGHNYLGSELHWLPIPYLKGWWNENWQLVGYNNELVLHKLETLDGIQPWCQNLSRPLGQFNDYHPEGYEQYYDCAQQHLEQTADTLDEAALLQYYPGMDAENNSQVRGRAWGQVYASLPVTRVTVLREPISWLRSKYDWHQLDTNYNLTCDDIPTATAMESYTDLHDTIRPGWVRRMALQYIFYLCGEDCHSRMEVGKATLQEIEAQAAYNLRHSFAVVGLLDDQDTFFEMIHARVDYMDMHLNTTNITDDGNHKSRRSKDCYARFNDAKFQLDLIDASPELASLTRLYEIGVNVNRFQMEELEQCSGESFVSKTLQ